MKRSSFFVFCTALAVTVSSANLVFANSSWLLDSGSGDLGGSLGTSSLAFNSYTGLSQYSANTPNTPLDAQVRPSFLDITLSSPAEVEFATTASNKGIGSDFLFMLQNDIPAGGNFMVTMDYRGARAASTQDDLAGAPSRFSFAPRFGGNAKAGDTITVQALDEDGSAVDFSSFNYVNANMEGFSDYIGGTDDTFTGTTSAVFTNATNNNSQFGVAFIDRTQEAPDGAYSQLKVTYTADPNGPGFAAGQQFRITVDGAPVPEPTVGLLALLGGLPILLGLRRRKK